MPNPIFGLFGSILGIGASVVGAKASLDSARFTKELAEQQAENTKKQAEFQAQAQLEQARYEAHVLDRERQGLVERGQLANFGFQRALDQQEGIREAREQELFGLGEEFRQFRGQTVARQAGSGLALRSRSFQNVRRLNQTRYQENRRRIEASGASRLLNVEGEKIQHRINFLNARRGAQFARFDKQFTLAQAEKAAAFTEESGLSAQTLTLQGGRAQASALRAQALGQGLSAIGQGISLIPQFQQPPKVSRG